MSKRKEEFKRTTVKIPIHLWRELWNEALDRGLHLYQVIVEKLEEKA